MNEQEIINYLHLDGNSVNNSSVAKKLLQYAASVCETCNALSDQNKALQAKLDAQPAK